MQCLGESFYMGFRYDIKTCLKKNGVPALLVPCHFFFVIMSENQGVGGIKYVLILQSEKLCIAELSIWKKFHSDIFKRKFFYLLNSTHVTFFSK